MPDYKISSFIIAIIIVSLVLTGFGLFMGELNNGYGRSDYNSTELSALSKQSEMADMAKNLRNATNIDKDASLFDVIGAYFSSGFSAVKLSAGSVDTFINMSGVMAKKTNIPYMDIIMAALIAIILIIIFVGIFLSLLVKDRI